MERSIKHSNDGGEAGVSRRSFLGGVSAAAVGGAISLVRAACGRFL